MASGDVAMIISFSDAARVEQAVHRQPPRAARGSWTPIQPTNRAHAAGRGAARGRRAGQLRAARSKSATRRSPSGMPATLYIFSDGKFPDVEGFSLGNLDAGLRADRRADGAERRHHGLQHAPPRGQARPAAGLRPAGELRRRRTSRPTSSCIATTRWSTPTEVELEAARLGRRRLRAGRPARRRARSCDVQPGGALALDDRGLGRDRSAARAPRCCWSRPATMRLELALATESAAELADVEIAEPDVLETQGVSATRPPAGHYRLVIYDQCQPKQMPQANTLFIGRLPPRRVVDGRGDKRAGAADHRRRHGPSADAVDRPGQREVRRRPRR